MGRWARVGAVGCLATCWVGLGCDDPPRETAPPCAEPTASVATAPASASAPAGLVAFDGRWVVLTPEGSEAATIELKREEARITYRDKTLIGALRGGSRRYGYAGEPGYVAKVKRRGPVIELRDGDNRIRCSAHLDDTTVRVAVGHEPNDVYRITPRKEGGFTLTRQAKVLGSVTPDSAGNSAVVLDGNQAPRFRGSAARPSALWAILLLDELDEPLRYLLMAELGARGR